MNYNELLDFLSGNLGFTLPDAILFFSLLACIILFAKNFKIGLIGTTLVLMIEFILFSLVGLQTYKVLIALLLSVVLLTISLYTSGSKVNIQ